MGSQDFEPALFQLWDTRLLRLKYKNPSHPQASSQNVGCGFGVALFWVPFSGPRNATQKVKANSTVPADPQGIAGHAAHLCLRELGKPQSAATSSEDGRVLERMTRKASS